MDVAEPEKLLRGKYRILDQLTCDTASVELVPGSVEHRVLPLADDVVNRLRTSSTCDVVLPGRLNLTELDGGKGILIMTKKYAEVVGIIELPTARPLLKKEIPDRLDASTCPSLSSNGVPWLALKKNLANKVSLFVSTLKRADWFPDGKLFTTTRSDRRSWSKNWKYGHFQHPSDSKAIGSSENYGKPIPTQ